MACDVLLQRRTWQYHNELGVKLLYDLIETQ
jgi:hypothetical protein